MRLILTFSVSDQCTYSYTETMPIEAESPEAAIVEFDERLKAAQSALAKPWCYGDFTACGRKFDMADFFIDGQYWPPTIQTFDEWFEANQE